MTEMSKRKKKQPQHIVSQMPKNAIAQQSQVHVDDDRFIHISLGSNVTRRGVTRGAQCPGLRKDRAATAQSSTLWQQATIEITLCCLVRATYMVLFFAHIPFVVSRALSATPTERLQQSQQCRKYFLQYSTFTPAHLRFERRDAKLVSCPACRLPSARAW